MNLGQNAYKPISFWSWNYDMRDEEICWQIQELKEKGYGGFFIHSRAGLYIPYMGDAWFHACEVAIQEAQRLGMDAWLYDEDGWPSGFAGGLVNGCGEDYCGKKLCFGIGKPEDSDARMIAVYRKQTDGTYSRIRTEDGTGEDLYCYYQIVRHYVDIMDDRVIAKFIEVTHEVYKKYFGQYFGNVVKGIFTDEPQMPDGPCWSLRMEQKYRETYQEDILDDLWLMHVKGEGYRKFRYRFWSCANELIRQNFAKQINDWCEENHLIFTGHFSSEDGLIAQNLTSGGVMPMYQHMGMPGIDHLGNRYATAVLLKQVTSVAHRRKLPYVLSESFGCAGWDISFKELLGIAGWQAVFGVNMLCTHVSAYSIVGRRKRDYPTFFSYQTPWWKDAGVLFGAIEKLNREIGKGERITNVAVLHPMGSVWCECSIDDTMNSKFLTAQFRELVDNLLDIQIDFDLLDESELRTATLTEEGITSGAVTYSRMIVPESLTLAEHTVSVLEQFAKAGGEVVFINGRPSMINGDSKQPENNRIAEIPAAELQNTRYILQKYFRAYPTQTKWYLYDTRMENAVSGLVSRYGETKDGAVIYLFNPNRGHKISTILKHQGRCNISVMNLTDDKETDITEFYEDGFTYANVQAESGAGVLIHVKYTEETPTKKEDLLYGMEKIAIEKVTPLEKNALTIDTGRYSLNGSAFSEKKAIIHMLDEIYSGIAACRQDSTVCVEYTFDTQFTDIPEDISLAVEKIDLLKVQINGQELKQESGWWIDKGIRTYSIREFVQNGRNVVLLTYTIPSTGQVNNLEGKFESERNRFCYKVEPENIYVRGSFDVVRNENQFVLTDGTAKCEGDITTQNMWFYSGQCAFDGTFEYDGESDIAIGIGTMHAVCGRVYVNGSDAGTIICQDDRITVTPYLKRGRNEIRVIADGHHRNLMGPHHHIRGGRLYFVGPSTFAGTPGFEDFISPEIEKGVESTWTDDYSFVPFEIRNIFIERR